MEAFRFLFCNDFKRPFFPFFYTGMCFAPVHHDNNEKNNSFEIVANKILNAPIRRVGLSGSSRKEVPSNKYCRLQRRIEVAVRARNDPKYPPLVVASLSCEYSTPRLAQLLPNISYSRVVRYSTAHTVNSYAPCCQ